MLDGSSDHVQGRHKPASTKWPAVKETNIWVPLQNRLFVLVESIFHNNTYNYSYKVIR